MDGFMSNPALQSPSVRRTQSERSAVTREKVIQAVIDCIVEQGLQNTTAARIVKRSGVTWGAIAHQFGDKDSLLLAVLEYSFELLSRNLMQSFHAETLSPRERVSVLITETWRRLHDPPSRAFLEIVLANRTASDRELKSRQEDMIVMLSTRIWTDLFGEFGIDPETIDAVRKLTFATLLGLSFQSTLGPRAPRFTRELAVLEENVLHTLGLDA